MPGTLWAGYGSARVHYLPILPPACMPCLQLVPCCSADCRYMHGCGVPYASPPPPKLGPMVPRALQPGEDRIATRQSAKVGDFGLANSCKRQTLPLHAACKACVPCWAPGTGVAAAPACANTSAQPWCNCSQLCHLQLLDQSVMSGSPSPVLCGSPAPQWTAQHRSEQRP